MCLDNMTQNASEPELRNPAYAAVFGSVIALGLPLNAASLWILVHHHGLRSSNAVFMVNLAISDLLLVISLPLRVHFFLTGMWTLGSIVCVFFTMLFRNNIRTSAIFITFISVDRLLAVVYPLRSRHLRTPSIAWKGVVFIWVMVIVVNIPESFHFIRQSHNCTIPICFTGDENLQISEVSYFQLVLVLTMLVVNIVSTVLVSWTLHRHLNDTPNFKNKVNVVLIFAMNLMMFTIFFVPVSLTVFFPMLRAALNCLASVNCCLDPLLYYFSFDGFWKRKEVMDRSYRTSG
ncbi:lysophosphatidic acid receptor 6-like [Pholidichthys leucotaenia]